jgi:hypothetical protein
LTIFKLTTMLWLLLLLLSLLQLSMSLLLLSLLLPPCLQLHSQSRNVNQGRQNVPSTAGKTRRRSIGGGAE